MVPLNDRLLNKSENSILKEILNVALISIMIKFYQCLNNCSLEVNENINYNYSKAFPCMLDLVLYLNGFITGC